MERVLGYIELGVKEGAKIAHGRQASNGREGRILRRADHPRRGENDMQIAQEETSGRSSSLFPSRAKPRRFASPTTRSMASAPRVWTPDMNAAHRLSRAIRAGTVWVNAYDRSSMATPFGGFKQSGFGRDRSPHAIDKYMDFKTIWTNYR